MDYLKQAQHKPNDNTKAMEGNCAKCGYSVHTKGSCPALGVLCRKCNKRNHFARVCRSTVRQGQVNSVVNDESAENVDSLSLGVNPHFLGCLESHSSTNDNVWSKLVRVAGLSDPIVFKLDTGADVSVIPRKLCADIKLKPPDKVLTGPGNTQIPVLGYFHTKLSVDNVVFPECLYVLDQNRALLSRKACVGLGLVSRSGEIDQVLKSDNKFMLEFPELFNGLGTIKQEAKVVMKNDNKPFAICTPRSVPYPLLDRVKTELENMVDTGVIFKVNQPTDWWAPMVVVPKINNKVRICVDYTELNKWVKREV